jgi:hypothetical protein
LATATFGSPLKKVYGEQCSLTTTAYHLAFMPNYHEVLMYCSSAWRMGLAPKLSSVKYYNASTYTDYTAQATDRVDTTHVPLDAMATTHYLYLGTTAPTRGFYFNVDGTNKNDVATTLDWEYLYDVSGPGYFKITGTITGALTVGETVTETTAADAATGVTATLVYSGASYIIVKGVTGGYQPKVQTGYDWDGAGGQSCNNVTAVDPVAPNTGYFTDVASDSDGTDSAGDTLKADGLYAFTLPSVVRGALAGINGDPLYWYRFTPADALSAEVDIVDIVPACDTVNYAFMEGGLSYQFALNTAQFGAFEFDHTATGTLDVTWIQH